MIAPTYLPAWPRQLAEIVTSRNDIAHLQSQTTGTAVSPKPRAARFQVVHWQYIAIPHSIVPQQSLHAGEREFLAVLALEDRLAFFEQIAVVSPCL